MNVYNQPQLQVYANVDIRRFHVTLVIDSVSQRYKKSLVARILTTMADAELGKNDEKLISTCRAFNSRADSNRRDAVFSFFWIYGDKCQEAFQ